MNQPHIDTPKAGAFWLCAGITIANAFTSTGFSLAALSSTGDAHTTALYLAVRSLSLAIAALSVAALRSRMGLIVVGSIMTLVQFGDALIGLAAGNLAQALGPAFLAVVTLVAIALLARSTTSE